MRLWRVVSAALLLVGCAVAIIPFAPSFPAAELDSAWMFAVNAAVGLGLAFGRDLVFTFGPYASLYTLTYHPATDGLAMATGAVLAIALGVGLVVLTPDRGRWRALMLVAALTLLWLRDPLFFIIPLVFLALAARLAAHGRRRTGALVVALILLAAAMALLPLIKGTFAAGVAMALGLGGLLLLARGYWVLAIGLGLVCAAAMAGFWMMAHQDLAYLPGFFTAQSRIVAGYTEAMSLPGPLWQVALYGGLAALIVLLNLPAALRSGAPGLTVLAGAAALMLLAFKAGFVRQDAHIAIAAGALGLIAGVLSLANRGAAPALGLLVGLVGWGVLDRAAEGMGPRRAWARIETAYRDAARGMLDRLDGGPALAKGYADALSQIRRDYPVPPLAGPADIYSTGQSVLLAHGIPWSPRPVLQSYSAYSPALEQDDAAHLTGSDSPRNVLMALQPIDDRLPALEDGLSWLPLLQRYDAIATQGSMVVFDRRPRLPGPAALGTPGPIARHGLGETVALSRADGPLWAEIDVKPTLLGRLVAAAFKPPPLHITMHLANGQANVFRYVSGMGRAGFMISPVVGSALQLVALQVPDAGSVFDDYVPTGFSIAGDARFWQRSYSVRLTPVSLESRPQARAVLFKAPTPITPGTATGAKCWLDLVNGQVVDHAKPLTLSGMTRLNGWGFGEVAGAGVQPDSVALSMIRADGTAVGVTAITQSRADVGAYFKQPALSQIGYQALVDLRGVSGDFTLSLELAAGDRHWSCGLIGPVTVPAETP